MEEDPEDQVKKWFEELIEITRDDESNAFSIGIHLPEPCQIEVFWMDDPLEGQLYITTDDNDRPDKEVLVHGPWEGSSFIQEVGEVAKSDRWQKPLPPPIEKKPGHGVPLRVDSLANATAQFINSMENSLWIEYRKDTPLFAGRRLWGSSQARIYPGNVAELDLEKLSQDAENVESDGQNMDEGQEEEMRNNEAAESISKIATGGGYIYKPVWIEESPEYTFFEKVQNKKPRTYDRIYRSQIQGVDIHAFRDGLLLLESEDGNEIQDILNTLFGIGIFHQFRTWQYLLRRELISAHIADGEIRKSSYELATPSGRNQLSNPSDRPDDSDRDLLPMEVLKRLINIVDVIYPIHSVRERIILHLQAHTHLLDSEFDASFVLNWTVIE